MTGWAVADIPSQTGMLAVVTGTGGIGLAVALALARAGADVILAGRDPKKGSEAVLRIRSVCRSDIRFSYLDLAKLHSVEAFAERVLGEGRAIDVLINNAGVMMPKQRSVTEDGFELQFGVNHLGHFALTGRLLSSLKAARSPRVVTVSSGAHVSGKIFFDDLHSASGEYKAYRGYQQSKLANILFTRELQRRSAEARWGLLAVAAHPGYARTELLKNGPGRLGPLGIVSAILDRVGQDADGGALPILYAATASAISPGGYYGPRWNVSGPPTSAKIGVPGLDDETAGKLWSVSEKLTKVHFA